MIFSICLYLSASSSFPFSIIIFSFLSAPSLDLVSLSHARQIRNTIDSNLSFAFGSALEKHQIMSEHVRRPSWYWALFVSFSLYSGGLIPDVGLSDD